MTPDQTRVIEAAMEEYRTSVRPLTVLYARIARRFGLPETVPGLVNNAVRVAFDHLSEVLAGDEPAQFTPGGQDAMWHLLLARCDLLMMCVDTVRNGVEAMAASVDEHTAETERPTCLFVAGENAPFGDAAASGRSHREYSRCDGTHRTVGRLPGAFRSHGDIPKTTAHRRSAHGYALQRRTKPDSD